MEDLKRFLQQQKYIYALVEKLINANFKNPVELLIGLITDVVDNNDIVIKGARIWEFLPNENVYELKMQYGELAELPKNYKLDVQHQNPCICSVFDQNQMPNTFRLNILNTPQTTRRLEGKLPRILNQGKISDEEEFKSYSVTGIGPILKTHTGKYYKYLVGFNAIENEPNLTEILALIGSLASIAIRNMNFLDDRKAIREDLKMALEVQKNILPEHSLFFNNYEFYGVCIQDKGIGGDYFDYLQIDVDNNEEKRLGIVVSDSSSKGIPAAIQAIFISGAFRMGWSYTTDISDLFSRMNDLVFKTFQYERLVTLYYCEFTMNSDNVVLYINAGHCSPILYRVETGEIIKLEPTGGILGLLKNQDFTTQKINMNIDDVLVIYTDGITEAMDKNNNLFGEERLESLIKENNHLSSKEIALLIIEKVFEFSKDSAFNDDKTIVVVKRKKITA